MTVRDSPTCHLAAMSVGVVCLGLLLPDKLSVSFNSSRLRRFSRSLLAVLQLVCGHVSTAARA